MEIPMVIPRDVDGYIRRQCPRCEREFKWLSKDDARPMSTADGKPGYHCPYCGEISASDQWWTNEQVDYAQRLASMELMSMVEQKLRPSTEKINRSLSFVKIGLEFPTVTPPPPLFEPNDMIAVEPPCHPDEPFKVEEISEELHCLICGKVFVIQG